MALHEQIEKAVLDGHLDEQWTTGDLLAHAHLFTGIAASNLGTQPYNRSVSLAGLDLGMGRNANEAIPRFWRVGKRGQSILFSVIPSAGSAVTVRPVLAEYLEEDMRDQASPDVDFVRDRRVKAPSFDPAAPLNAQAWTALQHLVEQMHDQVPWDERLRGYQWRGANFEDTQRGLAQIMSQGGVLSRSIEQRAAWSSEQKVQAVAWAHDVFKWGGTPQKRPVRWEEIHWTLSNAVYNRIEFEAAPMNSGYTKVATFGTAYLEEAGGTAQVINDSRVATSLIARLEPVLQQHGWLPADLFPGLGRIDAARGGARRQVEMIWPNAYQRWSGQFAATAIVHAIKSILNEGARFPKMPSGEGGTPWTVRGVEAVLFMDGA